MIVRCKECLNVFSVKGQAASIGILIGELNCPECHGNLVIDGEFIKLKKLKGERNSRRSIRYKKLNSISSGHPICARCGFSEVINIHHIKERCFGGSDNPDNLIILCPNCHALFHRGLINQDELIKLKDNEKKFVEVSP